MFPSRENRHLVTAIGILVLYAVVTTAYIATLSPKLSFPGNEQQETLARAIELESRLREVAGLTSGENAFSVELRQDSNDASKVHAYVKRTSTAYPFATVPDAFLEHEHPAELRGESLFIIRRRGDRTSEAGVIDELWKYTITGKAERLYASPGIDFRASPNGVLIAIAEPSTLVIVRPESGEQRGLRWPELAGEFEERVQELSKTNGAPEVSLEGWSEDGSMFWGTVGWTGSPIVFFRIHPVTGAVKAYDARALSSSGEYALHPTTGRIAYSTYPRSRNADSKDTFRRSGKRVELRVLDLLHNRDTLIATSSTRPFHPQWIDASTLEYDDPENQRIRLVQAIEWPR